MADAAAPAGARGGFGGRGRGGDRGRGRGRGRRGGRKDEEKEWCVDVYDCRASEASERATGRRKRRASKCVIFDIERTGGFELDATTVEHADGE